MLETIREEWERGDTKLFAAVVLDGLSSGRPTDVDMPCQSLLSAFF